MFWFFAASALAKSPEVDPVSCDDLWVAVKATLDDTSNYRVMWENEIGQKASFVVVGALIQYSQKVALTEKGGGSMARAAIIEVGPDNADWRQFHHRVAESLAKLRVPKANPMVAGQP